MTHQGRITQNVIVAVAATLLLAVSALAQPDSEKVLYTFPGGRHGAVGANQVIFDSAGNLYGTAIAGGNKSTSCAAFTGVPGCGIVFKLTPRAHGAWAETVLYTFTGGSDGAGPLNGVVLDSAGNLYGTTLAGGDNSSCGYFGVPGCGVIFKLTPTAHGPWQETVLHTFTGGSDGEGPFAGVILDSRGNVYGSTYYGGDTSNCFVPSGCGVVFKLAPTASGPWNESVLYTFGVSTGSFPTGGLTFDPWGNLYGATSFGGDTSVNCLGTGFPGCGVVFKLSPTSGGPWNETILHAFTGGADGGYLYAGVIPDSHGNVYGQTFYGGDLTASNCSGVGCGVVYKLTPASDGQWVDTVLYTFTASTDGAFGNGSVILDSSGNLYGTADVGGDLSAPCNFFGEANVGCGVVFKLTPAGEGPWTESVLYAFTGGADGGIPQSNLLLDSAGNIFGITEAGGNTSECTGNGNGEAGCGVVFKLSAR